MQKPAFHAVLPLAALAIFIIATSRTAIAQSTMQFPVERDAGILAWDNHDGYGDPPVFDPDLETEEFSNHGLRTTIRGKKGTQHGAIMDWNTDEISAFIESNVDTSQPMVWTFNVYPGGDEEPNDDIQIETLESLNDWVEGDGGFFDYGTGGEFTNFNWSPDSQAATTNFAQTLHLFDDELIGIPWIDNDFGTGGIDDNQYSILGRADNFSTGLRIPDHVNSELLTAVDLGDAIFDSTYASVPLDDELIAELLGDPDNRGIIFGNNSAGENWQIATRDGDGEVGTDPFDEELRPGPKAPFLELFYTPKSPTTSADFNNDGAIDLLDIDLLYVELKSGGNDPGFDLDGNSLVDDADLRVWLTDAGAARGFGPIPPGDTNLDGLVNAADLNDLGVNWQLTTATSWGQGDFTYDSSINASDLNELGVNWLSDVTAGAAATVPEPTSALLLIVGIAMWAGRRRTCCKKLVVKNLSF